MVTNINRTVIGNHRETHRKKITGISNIPVIENNSSNVLDTLGASYLGNVVNLASSISKDNVAEQLVTEKFNNLIVTTSRISFKILTLIALVRFHLKLNNIMKLYQGLLQILATSLS